MMGNTARSSRRLRDGDAVTVRTRFDGSWVGGYTVASASEQGYRLRRRSDGVELPAVFRDDDLRPVD